MPVAELTAVNFRRIDRYIMLYTSCSHLIAGWPGLYNKFIMFIHGWN
jgi:hypothetical protein